MDARRAILLRQSKKVLTALLVAKHQRGGDSKDTIERLIDDMHLEKKRQVADRVLAVVSFLRLKRSYDVDCAVIRLPISGYPTLPRKAT